MQSAEELLAMMSQVRIPEDAGSLNGIVTPEGFICARGSAGEFDVLIPEMPDVGQLTESRVGSVRLTSGGAYRVVVGPNVRIGSFLKLSLASDRADLLGAFLFIIAAMLPDEFPVSNASALLGRLAEVLRLLQNDPQPTPETIKGLWAELWLIRASPDRGRLVRGWHGRATDKIDFEVDGRLLEVKCHEGRERIHSLRLDQLLLRPDETFVVSVCIASSPGGESIADFVREILPDLGPAESQRLTSQVLNTVGPEVELLSNYRFSIWPDVPPTAVPSTFVPRPLVDSPSVSMVSFRVDLSEVAKHHGTPLDTLLGAL